MIEQLYREDLEKLTEICVEADHETLVLFCAGPIPIPSPPLRSLGELPILFATNKCLGPLHLRQLGALTGDYTNLIKLTRWSFPDCVT